MSVRVTSHARFVLRFEFTEFARPDAGYNASQSHGVAKIPGSHRSVGGMQDNGTCLSYAEPTGTQAWQPVPGGDGFESVWHAADPGKITGSIQVSNIFRSVDGGDSRKESMAFDSSNGQLVTAIASSDQRRNPFTPPRRMASGCHEILARHGR